MKKLILLAFASLNSFLPNMFAQNFPGGFSQQVVAGVTYPTSMAFAPDGRIFVTEKSGKVRIIKNGSMLPTPFVQVSVNQDQERGLSAVALDPDFNNNHFVYIYYTSTSGTIHNRLSRFVANGDMAGTEEILLEIEPADNSIHNGGGMVFGPDGKLFIGIGDDGHPINSPNPNAQNLGNYKGKVLRMNTDGSVPSGNPFSGSPSADRIWCYGLRNPWTLSIHPLTGKIFVNDVGASAWEEINDATGSGKNFGWPYKEGNSSDPTYTNPVYTYPHGSTSCAISGGTFFSPSSTNYPSQYTGKYFFIDYCDKEINYIDPTNPSQKFNFASGVGGSNNYISASPDGNLYYFSVTNDVLYKITYSGANTAAQNDRADLKSQIYPNPMQDLATIKYSVIQNELVKLDLFEMSGKKLETLVDEIKTAGEYSALVEKNNLSKGLYFYKLQIGDAFEVKKIVIR